MIQRLTGNAARVSEDDVARATKLLDEYLKSPTPSQAVANHLDEIDTLLPALIELNIRQARADGKNDLAEALQDLLANVLLQIDMVIDEPQNPTRLDLKQNIALKTVLLVGIDSYESPFRKSLIAQALKDRGYKVIEPEDGKGEQFWGKCEVMIAHNPHANPDLGKGLAAQAASGKAVILDFDENFEKIPMTHPDFEKLGLKTVNEIRSYRAILQLANRICVSNQYFVEYLMNEGFPVELIPDSWDQENLLWHKPAPLRTTLNIGIYVLPGQSEDVKPIRRAATHVLREFPNTRLVVNGDLDVFRMFDSLPDARRLFLPPVVLEDYPYLLAQADLFLFPLLSNEFNNQRSDRRLMEAGIRRVPWIGSPIKSHIDWGSGGLVAYNAEEWYSHLVSLILDAELRQKLGKSGFQKAIQRENQGTGSAWVAVIESVLTGVQLA